MKLTKLLKVIIGVAIYDFINYVDTIVTYSDVSDRYPAVEPSDIPTLQRLMWEEHEMASEALPQPTVKTERIVH